MEGASSSHQAAHGMCLGEVHESFEGGEGGRGGGVPYTVYAEEVSGRCVLNA
jgi:hypothetical protein